MKRKTIKKGAFFIDIPIFGGQISVFVDMNHKEAVAYAKRKKYQKKYIEELEAEETAKSCNEVADKNCSVEAGAHRQGDFFFLFLKPYSEDWGYLDIVNHECFHLAQFFCHRKNCWDDIEPPAYIHGFIFTSVRHKLSGFKPEHSP